VIEKKKKNQDKKVSYSGGMYPNVPTRRVGIDVLPPSVSLVNPKSATCNKENRGDFSATMRIGFERNIMALWQ
jgi:hypothetical protein